MTDAIDSGQQAHVSHPVMSRELQDELAKLATVLREERTKKLSRGELIRAAAWSFVNSAFVVAALGGAGIGYLFDEYAATREEAAQKVREVEAKREASRRDAEARREAKLRLYERLVDKHVAANSYATLYCTNSALLGAARRLAGLAESAGKKSAYSRDAEGYEKTRAAAWDKWTDGGSPELLAMQTASLFGGTGTGEASTKLAEYWGKHEGWLHGHLQGFKGKLGDCKSEDAVSSLSDDAISECDAGHVRADAILRDVAAGAYLDLFPVSN